MTKSPLQFLLHLISIILFVEWVYWASSYFIIFNDKVLDTSLEFLYYLAPSLVALAFTILISKIFLKVTPFISNLILVLINTYSFLCIIMLTSGYCDFNKNLDVFYAIIVASILATIAFILFKNILPKMSKQDILMVLLATAIAFYDFLFSLIGFSLFYPGNW